MYRNGPRSIRNSASLVTHVEAGAAKTMAKREAVSCGRDFTCIPDLGASVQSAGQCG